jgi:thymidylate synthase (FAD)
MLTLRNLPPEVMEQITMHSENDAYSARTSVMPLEDVLYQPFAALDHGFVRVVDYMGGDHSVVQAARVSYGAGTKTVSDDRGLIRYLMSHWHSTPFEMPSIILHVKLPIFVARQWIRTRTASVNEYSARYSILDREFYLPRAQDLAQQSTTNNQGRGLALNDAQAEQVLKLLRTNAMVAYDDYEEMIDPEGYNLARELARINLPVSFYTQWYWKIDAHNLMNFLRLRNDKHAQMEIRVYAEVIEELFKLWMPLTAEAFRDYRKSSYNLSSMALEVIKAMLRGDEVTPNQFGMSKREWRDLMEALGRPV